MIDYQEELEIRGLSTFPSGSSYIMTNCPFPDHDDTNPSFSVSASSGSFRCFGCGESGSFVELISMLDDITIGDAIRKLKSGDDMSQVVSSIEAMLDEDDKKEISYYSLKSFHEVFPSVTGTRGEEYLLGRGIGKESIKRFDIRWGASGKFVNRVVLPIFMDTGKLLSYVGRTVVNQMPKTRKPRSPARALFGLYQLVSKKNGKLPYLIIVEGELDSVYLQQFGVAAVSQMGTSPLNEYQLLLIKRYAHKAVLSYDADDAGDTALAKQLPILRKYLPTIPVILPEEKDPNELSAREVEEYYGRFKS